MKTELELLLAFVGWGLEVFSRRDCGLLLAGLRTLPSERQIDRLLARLARERLLERQGRGQSAKFRITAAATKRVAADSPREPWSRLWDGKWRIVTFDLPIMRQKDRLPLWRALRNHKLGLLQRSVWLWPHPLETILQSIVQVQGIPEKGCLLDWRGHNR